MKTVDLNSDLGESFGVWQMGNDAAMIDVATSVNVACGFHGGDYDVMRKTVELAKARGAKSAPNFNFTRLKFMGLNLDFSIEKAKRELGYLPRVAFDDGMRQTIAWYKENA